MTETGLPFSYLLVLFQDTRGQLPDAADGLAYWKGVGEPDFPVMVDPTAVTLEMTPYKGASLPGKCVLSPEMEILECTSGRDEDDWAFDIIRAHAGL